MAEAKKVVPKKSFGCCSMSVTLPHQEYAKWQEKGWLGENGICAFPEKEQGFPMDVRLYGLAPEWWEIATDKDIDIALARGWLRIVDGNGAVLTYKDWKANYSQFPDPIDVLKIRHKIPPNLSKFVKVGKY